MKYPLSLFTFTFCATASNVFEMRNAINGDDYTLVSDRFFLANIGFSHHTSNSSPLKVSDLTKQDIEHCRDWFIMHDKTKSRYILIIEIILPTKITPAIFYFIHVELITASSKLGNKSETLSRETIERRLAFIVNFGYELQKVTGARRFSL